MYTGGQRSENVEVGMWLRSDRKQQNRNTRTTGTNLFLVMFLLGPLTLTESGGVAKACDACKNT